MQTTRRMVLAGAAKLATTAAFARTASADRYARAIFIDGLGAPDDPDGDEYPDSNVFSPRGSAQLRASGATAWQVTVGEVGNPPTTWDTTLGNIAQWAAIVDANPTLLVHGRTAADIRAAKTAGKAAIVLGTQDTAMAGTQLDRLDVLNGLGVRVVQLTYNLRNLSGDGALEPADAGLSKLSRRRSRGSRKTSSC